MGSKVADSSIPFLSQIEGEHRLNIEQAKALEKDSLYNAEQRRVQGDKLMGDQIAAYGASGVELDGTPMLQIQEDQKTAELEAMNIIYSGKLQSAMMKRKSTLNKQSAYLSLAKDGASMAISAGAFKSSGTGATTMNNGGGFDKASTGTNGYTTSGGGSISNKGIA